MFRGGKHPPLRATPPGRSSLQISALFDPSDIKRDGMYLELITQETSDDIADEYSGAETARMQITLYKIGLPRERFAAFIARAKSQRPTTTPWRIAPPNHQPRPLIDFDNHRIPSLPSRLSFFL